MNGKYKIVPALLFFIAVTSSIVIAAGPGEKPGKVFTGDKHITMQGMVCADCHGDDKGEGEVSRDTCISCHDDETIKESGKKQMEKLGRNPHDAHYIDLSCMECHQGHSADLYFCGTCHP